MNPIIEYYKNGNKKYEYYVNDLGQYHNEFGPAFISYYENGNKFSESYFLNDSRHNTKGPAYIKYNIDGKVEYKKYWLNNKEINVNSYEEFQKYIKRLNIS